jgi:hypothetical protein
VADTLSEPTADEQVERIYNRGMARAKRIENLNLDERYALCLMRLHDTVTPGDYPTLKTSIEAVTGVQEIQLIIDTVTRATLPAGKRLDAIVEVNLRIEDIPEP